MTDADGLADVLHIDAVKRDAPVLDVIETVDKVGDGSLASARAANKGNLLVGHRMDHDIEEHLLVGGVAKVDHVHFHAAVNFDDARF